ncbi:hypothetical protein HDU97_007609 [Phlyctochytrium planicorne]|nr:hypothetical protein HDU97_007609 [Phlyctochytrium planicorne]
MIFNLLTTLLAATTASVLAAPAPQNQSKIPTPSGLSATDDEIRAMCQAGPKTQWDQHVCKSFGNVQQGCMPQKRFAYGNKDSKDIKGVVLLFHGYTACPDAMEFLASFLQGQGYMTLTPLNVGHGLKYGDCSRPGAFCVQNTPIDQLPTRKEGYINYVKWAVDMVREELAAIPASVRAPDFTVSTMGLSLGGPLAATATSIGQDVFTKTVLVNPFFSAAVQFLDFQVQDCQAAADPQACINKLIDGFTETDAKTDAGQPAPPGTVGVSKLLERVQEQSKQVISMAADKAIGDLLLNRYPAVMRLLANTMATIDSTDFVGEKTSFLNGTYGWGADCFANTARPGYCIFQVKNLVALSAFGTYALSRAAQTSGKTIALITTERDGPVRNGLSYSAASVYSAKNNVATMCMYGRAKGCANSGLLKGDNECGTPHSAFSHAEQMNTAPFELYWEKNMFDNILSVLKGAKSIGAANFDDRSTCTAIQLGALNTYKDKIYDVSDIMEDSISRSFGLHALTPIDTPMNNYLPFEPYQTSYPAYPASEQ